MITGVTLRVITEVAVRVILLPVADVRVDGRQQHPFFGLYPLNLTTYLTDVVKVVV